MVSAKHQTDAAQSRRDAPAPGAFKRTIDSLSRACGVLAAFMIVAAVLVTCQMIFVRSVLNQSTVWQTEVVTYLMIGATLIGLPYVQLLRGHVNVDLLPLWLGNTGRRVLAFVTLVATAVILGLMFFYSVEMWYTAWDRGWTSDTVWAAPLWIPYLAMPVGFGLFLLQVIADLFAVISREETAFGMPEKR